MLIDTHAHLDFQDFSHDLDAVIGRAEAAGVARIMTIGTDLESSRRAVQISESHPAVYAVAGWHPGHALSAPPDIRSELKQLAAHPKVVALGETGLDYHHLPEGTSASGQQEQERHKARQRDLFEQHLEVAAETGLNLVIHQRDCFAQTLETLRPFADRVRGVFHCFVGTIEEMNQVLAVGSLVSFTGIVTFKNAHAARKTLAATPADKFMLETDSPYLAPVPFRGKRCEPAYVREIAAHAAQVRGCALDSMAHTLRQTAQNFFPKLG